VLFVLSVVGHTRILLPASLPGGPNESLTVTVAKSNFVPGCDHEQNQVVTFGDLGIRGVSRVVPDGISV
jgi:hypothetical protein